MSHFARASIHKAVISYDKKYKTSDFETVTLRQDLVLKLCPIDISSLRLENASLTPFGKRVTPAVQRYHVEPDGQADGQSLWLLQGGRTSKSSRSCGNHRNRHNV